MCMKGHFNIRLFEGFMRYEIIGPFLWNFGSMKASKGLIWGVGDLFWGHDLFGSRIGHVVSL